MNNLRSLILIFFLVFISAASLESACVFNSESNNNGRCHADVTENPDGTWTVNGYSCGVSSPEPGYPHYYNCVIGEELGGV